MDVSLPLNHKAVTNAGVAANCARHKLAFCVLLHGPNLLIRINRLNIGCSDSGGHMELDRS